jgi:hypothetical protein
MEIRKKKRGEKVEGNKEEEKRYLPEILIDMHHYLSSYIG